jgi:hypothetical protein
MARGPKASSGELVLPPQIIAATDLCIPFSDVVAICFDPDGELAPDADPPIVQSAYKSLSPKLWLKRSLLQAALASSALAALALVVDGFSEFDTPAVGLGIIVIMLIAPLGVQMFWHFWQRSGSESTLDHEVDPTAEAIFSELRAPGGPRLRVRSFPFGQYVPVNRRVLSSRLRYLLLSNDVARRSQVTAFPSFWGLRNELYLTPADSERLKEQAGKKRKGGPGRKPSYNYTAAIVSLARTMTRDQLPEDADAAKREIQNRFLGWFDEHADASCDVPRPDQVKRYADEFYEALMMQG